MKIVIWNWYCWKLASCPGSPCPPLAMKTGWRCLGTRRFCLCCKKETNKTKQGNKKTTKRQQQKKSLISLVRHLGSIKLHLEAGISYTECLKAWMKDLLGMKRRLSVTDFSLENNLPTFDWSRHQTLSPWWRLEHSVKMSASYFPSQVGNR